MRNSSSWAIGAAMILGLGLAASSPAQAQADGAQRWAFTTLSTSTAGAIVSSPAAAPDGTIYVGVEIGTSSSASPGGRVFAIAPDGAKRWEFATPDWVDSTPAIGADGTIYFGCWNGVLYAVRPDGVKRWELKVGSFVASSPAIGSDGTIYVGAGSNLVAVGSDGTLKWSFPAADWVDSSPAIGPDGTIFVGSWDNNLYAIRPDGVEKWRFTADDNISSSPAIGSDGTVYIGSRDARLYALTATGALKWSFDTTDTIESAPVLASDGTVYITTTGGRLFALGRDGAEHWRFPRAGQTALAALYSTPAVRADGSIVFGSSNNAVYALRSDGTQQWRTAIGDVSDSSPLVTNNAIYLGCADKKLYSLASTSPLSGSAWPQFHRDLQRTGRAVMAPLPAPGRLINLSVRTSAGAGADTLIVGFVVSGAGGRSLLVRGVGPSLTQFGVTGNLADPRITLYSGSTQMASNDNWGQAGNASTIASTGTAVGAFALPNGSLDSAWLNTVSAGGYTVQVSGAGGATGIALMETYDGGGAPGARLANVSARSAVGTANGVLIAGFVVGENASTLLIRGIGPSLSQFNVPGVLTDPQLQIFRGDQLVASNDDWTTSDNPAGIAAAAQAVGAFPLANGSRDAVLLISLTPGAYTATVSGVNGTTGVGLVEVYEVP